VTPTQLGHVMQAPIDLRPSVLTSSKASSTPEGNKSRASDPQQNLSRSCPDETPGGAVRTPRTWPKPGEQGGRSLFGRGRFEPGHGSTAVRAIAKKAAEVIP